MPSGRQSRPLTAGEIERLEDYRFARSLSIPQLKLAMPGAPFKWRTLAAALEGKPIWDLSHRFITEWLEKYVPERKNPAPADGKLASASGGDEEKTPSADDSPESAGG